MKFIKYLKTLLSEPDKRNHIRHVLVYGGLFSLLLFVGFEYVKMPRYLQGLAASILGYGAVFVYGIYLEHKQRRKGTGQYEKRDIVANGIAAAIGIILLPLLLLLPQQLPW